MKREDLRHMLMMMMKNRSTDHLKNEISWKLYENPFYHSNHHHHHQQQQPCHSSKHHHHQGKPVMHSESGVARAEIIGLKAELDHERKARKKVESLNKKLAKQVAEERRGKQVLKTVCEKLATEITSMKSEIDRTKKEFEEEKKMIKMAEILREERVQMKLADAKILFEEKSKELEEIKRRQSDASKNKESSSSSRYDNIYSTSSTATTVCSSMAVQRRASKEAENPHIKRGIKGFVEFPRMVRAIGSKSRCQKPQLRILPTSK